MGELDDLSDPEVDGLAAWAESGDGVVVSPGDVDSAEEVEEFVFER